MFYMFYTEEDYKELQKIMKKIFKNENGEELKKMRKNIKNVTFKNEVVSTPCKSEMQPP